MTNKIVRLNKLPSATQTQIASGAILKQGRSTEPEYMTTKGIHMKIAQHSRARHVRSLSGFGAVLLLIMSFGVSAAELYRWTDARGVTHYTDKPPRGVNAERVATKRPATLGNPARDTEAAEEEAPNPDAERCKAEQDRLSILQSNKRVQMENRDGTVRELSDAEIQQEIEFSQRAVDRFCKPQAAAE